MKVFIFLILIPIIHGLSTPSSSDYRAGVLEYNPFTSGTPEQNVAANLVEYLKFIDQAATENLDILVFPESSLNRFSSLFLPEKGTSINPCDDQQYEDGPIKKISCAVKKSKVYVLINVTEKSKCPDQEMRDNNDGRDCPADGFVQYNTNVVFDRSGTIISKYRKFNLFRDPGIFKPKYPQTVTFDTDFGVKFGHFICFDMVFYDPAVKLVKELGVTDIVYPTMWFSELYIGVAVPYQHHWALANDVNLLAAGSNDPSSGSSGSGIYAGKMGTIVSFISGSNNTKLLVANVPKKPRTSASFVDATKPETPQQLKGLKVLSEDLSAYESHSLKLMPNFDGSFKGNLCKPEPLCCYYELAFNQKGFPQINDYQYRAIFFTGNRTFQERGFGNVTACFLVACLGDTMDTCGQLFNDFTNVQSITNFWRINITTTFKVGKNDLVMPYTLSSSLLPLPLDHYKYSQKEDVFEILATRNLTSIINFGIFAQHFEDSGSETLKMSLLLLIASSILLILRF